MLTPHINSKPFLYLTAIAVFCVVSFLIFTPKSLAAFGINRQINFQGKLVNNPAATNVSDTTYTVIFTFYDKASGGTNLWTETQTVTTTDGIFRVSLGSVTAIPANFNFNWDGLYLGMKVNSDSEMTPRIQMTAVPFAFNAQQVAGLTVQDTSGNASTSGTLQIANGKTINLGTQNLTFTTSGDTTITLPASGTLSTLAGAETLTNKIIGSGGLTFTGATTDITTGTDEDLTINANGTGKLVLSDAITLSTFTSNGGVLYTNGSGVLAQATAGTASQCLLGGTTPTFGSCGAGTSDPFWSQSNGALYPNNSTVDLLVGGQSTSSAQFAVLNVAKNQAVATVSGQLIVMPNNGWGGQVGIGTTDPTANLNLIGSYKQDTTSLGNGNVFSIEGYGFALFSMTKSSTNYSIVFGNGDYGNGTSFGVDDASGNINFTTYVGDINLYNNKVGGLIKLTSSNIGLNGNVGINTDSPLLNLDVRGSSGILGVASFSGQTSFSPLIIDQRGVGDIFSASSSGLPLFTVTKAGNVIPGTNGGQDLGSTTRAWRNVYGTTYFSGATTGVTASLGCVSSTLGIVTGSGACPGGGGSSGPFQELSGAIVPNNSTVDLLVGGQSTASALFRVTGSAAFAGTKSVASISAQTSFSALVIDQKGNGDLFTASASGLPLFTVTKAGNVIPGTNNGQDLGSSVNGWRNIYGNTYYSGATIGVTASLGCVSSTLGIVTGSGACSVSSTDTFWNQSSGALYPNNSTVDLLVGGQASTSALFRVTGSSALAGTKSVASISANTSFSAFVIDQSGNGDIFTASASGNPIFTITKQGNVDIAGSIRTGTWSGTAIGVTKGGTGLSSIAAGSVLGANSADTFSAITSTSGLKVLQNSAGTITWASTTGTGNVVYDGSPTLTTPALGIATATSINKVAITAPASAATLTIANNKTLTANNTLTLAGTDSTTITFQGTDTYVGLATTDVLTNKSIGSTGLTFSGATTDITTGTNEALTITPNGSGDMIISGDADTNLQVTFGAAPGVDMIALTNAGQGTTTNGVDGLGITFETGGTTSSADNAGLRIDVTSNNSGTTTTLEGIYIGNLASAEANSTETALRIGSGWDQGILIESGNNDGTGMVYSSGGRPTKRITLSPEYAGAVLSAYYGAGTDTNITGSMTSDTDTTQGTSIKNYYSWLRTTDATQHYYNVAVRVTLPKDFSAWTTSNALVVNYRTESATNTVSDLDVRVYNENNATIVASSVDNASTSWTTIAIDDSTLDDGASSEWDEADETAVIYLRMGSASSKYVQVGDIQLNYLAKF